MGVRGSRSRRVEAFDVTGADQAVDAVEHCDESISTSVLICPGRCVNDVVARSQVAAGYARVRRFTK